VAWAEGCTKGAVLSAEWPRGSHVESRGCFCPGGLVNRGDSRGIAFGGSGAPLSGRTEQSGVRAGLFSRPLSLSACCCQCAQVTRFRSCLVLCGSCLVTRPILSCARKTVDGPDWIPGRRSCKPVGLVLYSGETCLVRLFHDILEASTPPRRRDA